MRYTLKRVPQSPKSCPLQDDLDDRGLFSLLFLVNGLLVGSLLGRFHPEPAYPRSVRVSRVVTGVIAVVCLLGIFAHTVPSYRSPKFSMVVLWFMHLKFDSRLFPSYSCWACVPP